MSDIELWNRAGAATRDASNLFLAPFNDPKTMDVQTLNRVIVKALGKLREVTAATEALQRISVGCEQPKRGD